MKKTSALSRNVQLAFGAAIAILLVVGAFSYRGITISSEKDRWVEHTHEVLKNLDELLIAMTRAESSGRGFLLTGDEATLAPFRASQSDAEQNEANLRALVADSPEQERRLSVVEGLAAQKIQFLKMADDLRRTGGADAASGVVQSGRGHEIMAEFQAVVREMQDQELQLLAPRTADAKRVLGQTRVILILGTILGLLITTAAAWSVQRDGAKRKLAEKALHDSDDKYQSLVQGVRDYGIVMLSPQGEILSWNPGAELITGCAFEEVAGQNFSRFFLADDVRRGRAEEILRIAAASGMHEEHGMRARKDGTRFLVRTAFTALHDAVGGLRGFSLISQDVSASTESEAKYRGLLEAAPDAMVVVNQRGEIVILNLQAEKQFGYRRDELLGQQVASIIPDGFAERLIADGARSAEDALAQQIGTGIELTGRRKNGSEFPIELMLSPLASVEGTLVTAAIRDISVRKAAETRLAQVEGQYRGLLEAAPDAMVVVNQRSEIVILNLQAEKQFGYRRDELLGQQVKNIIPDGFAERLIADGARSAEDALAQQIGTGIELYALRKDGTGFPIELMLSPLASPEGILVTAAIRDITLRKKSEAHLVSKVEELKRSNEELEQFAYLASHDLQEPLRMVASYTQLLSRRYKGKLDSDADDYIAFAVDGASRMQRLIKDLLAYSRVGTKGQELLPTSSEEALVQSLRNLRGAIEERSAVITHDPLPMVCADEMQLVQLFQNLVGNAIKYKESGQPHVHISVIRNRKMWKFAVKDDGLGIDPQYFERIFGMFQRLHKREEYAGTGIGLAICKKIVERHGGTISVQSKPGEGSTFSFNLSDSEVTA